jgi:hypothetical protein
VKAVFFKKLLLSAAVALLVIAAPAEAARRSVPIVDIPVVAVPWPNGQAGSPDAVKAAILAGLVMKSWTGQVVAPGLIRGTLLIRTHRVEVDIAYTATEYSIKYADSDNLGYRADKREIHPKYNGWVRQLRETIVAQFLLRSMG